MNIETLRLQASYVIAVVAVIMGTAALITEYVAQGGAGLGSLLAGSAGAALIVTFVVARKSQAFRFLAVSVLMAQVMALLIAARGYSWQVDVHMVFFAALALSVLMYDARAIILGTALVAVHHLVLGLAMPELVFYEGGGLARVLLHAVILVVEAAGLLWLSLTTSRLLSLAHKKSDEAALEALKLSELSAATTAERGVRDEQDQQILHRLEQSFGRVVADAVEGRFDGRVEEKFGLPVFDNLARSINALIETVQRGLGETGGVLAGLAQADLTRRVEGQYVGEFGALKDSTNAVADRLNQIIGQLKETSRGLKTATGEILSGANDLSERTTKQAATIEQTSAAMEQLATTVQQNAERAKEASSVAGTVTRTADEGGKVMGEANQAMERITASSSKITNIIGLIDDIAFQTNLLALNASVEAARAGDQGLCCGRRGSAAPRAVGRQRLLRGQGPHRPVEQRGESRLETGCRSGVAAAVDARGGPLVECADGWHGARVAPAGLGHRGGHHCRPPARRDDPAQCGAGRADQRGDRADRGPGQRARPRGRPLHRLGHAKAGTFRRPGFAARTRRHQGLAAEGETGRQFLPQPRQCRRRQGLGRVLTAH